MARPKEFSSEEVLDRAIEYFTTRTYHEATVRNLARHMGIGPSSFYHTFGDKHRVYVLALSRYLKRLQAEQWQVYSQAEASPAGLRDCLERMIDAHIAGYGDWGRFAVNAGLETILYDPEVHDLLLDNEREFDAIFEDFFRRCQSNGTVPQHFSPLALARFTEGMIAHVTQRARLTADRQALEEIVAVALRALI
jgi:TetR/AcrR family transcriptional regulator, transcriptional repressor for nem operon